ncbi:STAS domain-containing protein [Streptomyces sp. NPDC049627]|uniref:STAS domain-containing protein n=1 Tax=Streptomyces sp. NPDC049627 TaxID=3365595 RepID=UPI003794E15E
MYENHAGSAPPLPARIVAGTTVAQLRGEVDLHAASTLAARLDELTAGTCPDLVLDLRDVSFIDCSGLGVLCRARSRVLARQGRLRLIIRDARILRLLRLAGLAGVFEIHTGWPASLDAEAMTVTAAG